jgi:hypothetical protein
MTPLERDVVLNVDAHRVLAWNALQWNRELLRFTRTIPLWTVQAVK